jgi:uncharacterized protein (DUF302 family)
MTEPLQSIHYGTASPSLGRASRLSFGETLASLKAAIAAEGLWLLHEIDPQMLLGRGGFGISPARQLLFFHPRYLVRLLEADPSALIEAPLKVAVLELPDGTVWVRQLEVAQAFARYQGLAGLGEELAALSGRILAAVVA